MTTAAEKARQFIENETQFHLGCLPTEQSNPLSRGLSGVLQKNTADGIRLLQRVDREIVEPAKKVFASKEFAKMLAAILRALDNGGKIVFSGCGATGRLSILLESAWREFWQGFKQDKKDKRDFCEQMENSVFSIMTGGDYALVRSVENFEDYQQFGRRQAQDLNIKKGDVLIAISEGGETSSVIGTIHECVDRGAEVFFLFNNPADVLCENVQRSREVITHEKVTVIPLYSGPMAVAGSTRMQATTFEMLAAGAALELALGEIIKREFPASPAVAQASPDKYTQCFTGLLEDFGKDDAVAQLAALTELEAEVYRQGARVTYYAGSCLLDIFTDTTERAPTFMLPPFRKCDDAISPASWAFVKHPCLPTGEAWLHTYRRAPRCLEWTPEDYKNMKAPENLIANPPKLRKEELFKFMIGCEDDSSRYEKPGSLATFVCAGKECEEIYADKNHPMQKGFKSAAAKFSRQAVFFIGSKGAALARENGFCLAAKLPESGLRLWDRLAVKLAFNTISTATMGLLGRLSGNWMAHVEASNKKLIDRSTRLISELAGLSYNDACLKLHEALEELKKLPAGAERPSPVQKTLEMIAWTNS